MDSQRRKFLFNSAWGFGSLALTSLLADELGANQRGDSDSDSAKIGDEGIPERAIPTAQTHGAAVQVLHHPPRAKRVVQLFMAGAASHIDLFDYKPALAKHHGEPSDFGEQVEAFQNGLGPWMKSPFKFRPYGQSGKRLSAVVSDLGCCVDDIAFIHNMIGKTGVHSRPRICRRPDFDRPGFPGMGSWVSYALGSLNDNLPTFVVLPDHRGYARNGPKNWGRRFLPTSCQGTAIFPQR